MKPFSWEHYSLDAPKMIGLACGTSLIGAVFLYFAMKDILVGDAWIVSAIAGGAIAYLILTEPRREFDTASLRQAREAPVIAASAAVSLEATGSKGKALMLLSSEEEEFASTLHEVKRRILLGYGSTETILDVGRGVASDSAARALFALATHNPASIEDEGQELESGFAVSSLGEETKVPIFIAVCFFAPIMLLLFAVLSRKTGPTELAELFLLQLVILNLVFALSSREKGKLRL